MNIHNRSLRWTAACWRRLAWGALTASACVATLGCHHNACGPGGLAGRRTAFSPAHDRPFPHGQVSDSFWETQQTNAEAADFILHDHEFVQNSALLTPGAKRHLESVALRLEHAPFPVVIERSEFGARPEMDEARRRMVVEQLARIGVTNAEARVVVAHSFAPGITAIEGERAYYSNLGGNFANGAGGGRRFGGFGGTYR